MGAWIGFIAVTIVSLAFAGMFLVRPEMLTAAWTAVRGLPAVIQVVAWVLLLPWMLSLWIWRSSWPMWLRLLLVVALVAGTPIAFFPRQR